MGSHERWDISSGCGGAAFIFGESRPAYRRDTADRLGRRPGGWSRPGRCRELERTGPDSDAGCRRRNSGQRLRPRGRCGFRRGGPARRGRGVRSGIRSPKVKSSPVLPRPKPSIAIATPSKCCRSANASATNCSRRSNASSKSRPPIWLRRSPGSSRSSQRCRSALPISRKPSPAGKSLIARGLTTRRELEDRRTELATTQQRITDSLNEINRTRWPIPRSQIAT